METINKVIIKGYIGQKPKIKYVAMNKAVAEFSLATHEEILTKDGTKRQITEWHSISFWGKIALEIETYNKGDLVEIEGKLSTQVWVDKNQIERKITKIIGNNIFLHRKIMSESLRKRFQYLDINEEPFNLPF